MNKSKQIEAYGQLLAWYGGDLAFFNEFQRFAENKITPQEYSSDYPRSFQDFLNSFKVTRTLKKGATEELLKISKCWFDEGHFLNVNGLVEKIEKAGIVHGRPVSMASKIMFLMKPELILPYDSRAKKTLDMKPHEIDYTEYLTRAQKFENIHLDMMTIWLEAASEKLEVVEKDFPGLKIPFPKVRKMRFLDKLLWVGT